MAIRSEAQRKAVAKYNAANYERIELRVDKGQKDIIKAHVGQHSEYEGSVNRFINVAIAEQIKRDNNE